MQRCLIVVLGVLSIVLLSGCDRQTRGYPLEAELLERAAPAAPPANALAAARSPTAQIAYSHEVTLEMRAESVSARFDRARQQCLENSALKCILVRATVTAGDLDSGTLPSATIEVRLPHDTIDIFQKDLLTPLPGEKAGQIFVRSRATNAEDLTATVTDNNRRLAQANDYRERLDTLAKNSGAKVADLIQVEEKLAETQAQIESFTAEQRGLSLRVDTEDLTIDLNTFAGFATASSPLARAWHDAGRVLGDSAASAFLFVIAILPWLPLLAIGYFLLTWLWRFVRATHHRMRMIRMTREHSEPPAA